uniref:Uncharacterized protein n=1 Tax=viral metagenome TaxID=1070528 RepID=A0A6C0HME8_9ZZZZ
MSIIELNYFSNNEKYLQFTILNTELLKGQQFNSVNNNENYNLLCKNILTSFLTENCIVVHQQGYIYTQDNLDAHRKLDKLATNLIPQLSKIPVKNTIDVNYLELTPYKLYWFIKLYEVLLGNINFNELLEKVVNILINYDCKEFKKCSDDIYSFLDRIGLLNELFIPNTNSEQSEINIYKNEHRIIFSCPANNANNNFKKYNVNLNNIIKKTYNITFKLHDKYLQDIIKHKLHKNVLNYMPYFINYDEKLYSYSNANMFNNILAHLIQSPENQFIINYLTEKIKSIKPIIEAINAYQNICKEYINTCIKKKTQVRKITFFSTKTKKNNLTALTTLNKYFTKLNKLIENEKTNNIIKIKEHLYTINSYILTYCKNNNQNNDTLSLTSNHLNSAVLTIINLINYNKINSTNIKNNANINTLQNKLIDATKQSTLLPQKISKFKRLQSLFKTKKQKNLNVKRQHVNIYSKFHKMNNIKHKIQYKLKQILTTEGLITYLTNNKYNNIAELIKNILPNQLNLSYDSDKQALGGIEDPFLSIQKPSEGLFNLYNLNDWYKNKNPAYKNISTLPNLQMPELQFITAIMVKNLFVLLKTNVFPQYKYIKQKETNIPIYYNSPTYNLNFKKFNRLNIELIFDDINTFIMEQYVYNDYINLYCNYIDLFNQNKDTDFKAFFNEINKNTNILIYPTVRDLSYAELIFTMQAPFSYCVLPVNNYNCAKMYYNLHTNIKMQINQNYINNSFNKYIHFINQFNIIKDKLINASNNNCNNDTECKNANILVFVIYQAIYINGLLNYITIIEAIQQLLQKIDISSDKFINDKTWKNLEPKLTVENVNKIYTTYMPNESEKYNNIHFEETKLKIQLHALITYALNILQSVV